DACAVVFEDRQLDYATLDREANRLAHHLRTLGVGPDVVVALCMQRSPGMVVAMLGVLKAGGAWVPIDPDYPVDRIAFVLDDSAAPVVLTQQAALDRIRETGTRAHAIALDSPGWRELADALPATRPEPLAGPDHLAYVIYTSGSTGKPKGAMIPHRGIVNRVLWNVDRIGMTERDRLLQKTTYTFDASVWEFFSPLAIGAPVTLARHGGERDAGYLVEAVGTHRITILELVPSALRALLLEPSLPSCTTLRYVGVGGEPLDWALVREFERCLPGVTLGNYYGPTEASDVTTSIDVTGLPEAPGPVPIGRPIANARVHVLDAALRPVPIGVIGELYIGGVGLARGYLNRPELTAERFVPNPFVPGERLYRTGDLVFWRPDGVVGFVGRTDHQVKLRGQRIELGEIEAALNACEGIRQSVVVMREDRPGDRRLVGYVEGDRVDADALKAALRARLPGYMVPAAVVPMAALPRLSNGKLDRKSLPAPAGAGSEPASTFVAARTPIEEALVAIWADVLGRERVGVHDDFFDLGGHSLTATQAMSRMRAVLGADLPLHALFEAPTVAGLSQRIRPGAQTGEPDLGPPLVAGSTAGADVIPASAAQQALWTIDRLAGPSGLYNICAATRLEGPLDTEALRIALQAFVDRHAALRTGFDDVDGVPVQAVLPNLDLELPIVELQAREAAPGAPAIDDEIHRLAIEPFDLARAPLFRARLLRASGDDHVLVFVVHHIVADGWSMGILARELPLLYERARRGERPAPAAGGGEVDFADYARWERARLASGAGQAALAYWREQLAGIEPIELPTDRPRPRIGSLRGGSLPFTIPADRVAALKALARANRATLHMVLLATFETLLMRYSGQQNFAVGTPAAGRSRAELEGVFGMFANMLVMRADLAGEPGFVELLGRVRQTALDAYSNQDMPFERIVAELNPQREPNRNPLFQVAFAMQNVPPTALELPGVESSPVESRNDTAKFDLGLSFVERGGDLHGSLRYAADLFDDATIERMAGHFRNLVDGIVADPNSKLSALPLMGARELDQILVQWNDTAHDYPLHKTLHQLFEEQAARTPDACAVVFEDR
ncbi:MAG TPA: amino acid adenylation domain-containing protein, partial [Zeimonas sp.]|nr:amino acid adenylation domain-containing protein [Zeimonas sp.]